MGAPLTPGFWLLSVTPILVLLIAILVLKWSTYKSGAVAWLAAVLLAVTAFGLRLPQLLLACSKGLSLSLYVLLIIWGAVFLYNIANRAGAIQVIGDAISRLTGDRLLQGLLLAWCFTSVLQGLAGFGVPIAVVAPILVILGFQPVPAVACCLIGHAWSISFGSMGSSYNTIQLVTKLPGEVIGPTMALLFILPIFATGLSVAHIIAGRKGLCRALPPVLAASVAMSGALYLLNLAGLAQLSSLLAAAVGTAIIILWIRLSKQMRPSSPAMHAQQPQPKAQMNFLTAVMPYLVLICLSALVQIPAIKAAVRGFAWGLDYPQMTTALGYVTPAEPMYSKIIWLSHPAVLLLLSAFTGFFLYTRKAGAEKSILRMATHDTVKKCVPTSIGIATMVMMAMIMSNSGMTFLLAQGIALGLGSLFPIVSPLIGILGSFLTGSNTNSNVMFGLMQYETAQVIGRSGVLIAAAQSVGGSLGVSIAPSTIMMGAANVGAGGQESKIMSITIRYCLPIALLVGLIVWLLS